MFSSLGLAILPKSHCSLGFQILIDHGQPCVSLYLPPYAGLYSRQVLFLILDSFLRVSLIYQIIH